jgi:hypothetical protein
MGKIVRVEQNGSRSSATVKTNSTKVRPDGWYGATAAVCGDDGCRIEDLSFKGMDKMEAIEMFAYLDPQPSTQSQAIGIILERCRAKGVTVVPGETVKNQDGQWTFRDWYLSR